MCTVMGGQMDIDIIPSPLDRYPIDKSKADLQGPSYGLTGFRAP